MNDQAKALLFVAALFGGVGFTGGRMTSPEPPAEVRIVRIPIRPQIVAAPVAAHVAEPAPAPAPPPHVAAVAEPEAKPPLPVARPKPDPKPKERPQPKPRAIVSAKRSSLPSCAVVKREYERMTWTEKMAAYHKASSEEIAHGRRCLGL
jgi:outer membrane biosynthesis protein TonB